MRRGKVGYDLVDLLIACEVKDDNRNILVDESQLMKSMTNKGGRLCRRKRQGDSTLGHLRAMA